MVCIGASLFRNKRNKKAVNNIDTADPAYVTRNAWHDFRVLVLFYLDFYEYRHQALHAHSVQSNITQVTPRYETFQSEQSPDSHLPTAVVSALRC